MLKTTKIKEEPMRKSYIFSDYACRLPNVERLNGKSYKSRINFYQVFKNFKKNFITFIGVKEVNNAELFPHVKDGKWIPRDYKKEPAYDDFDSLIEQAVNRQNASFYSELTDEMQLALGVAALRENKTRALDAEFEDINEMFADILESKGSTDSLSKFYERLVDVYIKGTKQYEASVAYCIDCALEKEEDHQAYLRATGDDQDFDWGEVPHNLIRQRCLIS